MRMIKIVRAIFLILVTVVSIAYIKDSQDMTGWYVMIGGVLLSFAFITIDIFYKKKNLMTLSGISFGLLVGILSSLALQYLAEQVIRTLLGPTLPRDYDPIPDGLK